MSFVGLDSWPSSVLLMLGFLAVVIDLNNRRRP